MQQRVLRTRRMVWAVVTREPRISLRKIAHITGMPVSTVHDALENLKAAGYIDFPKGAERARTVLVPFVVAQKADRNGYR